MHTEYYHVLLSLPVVLNETQRIQKRKLIETNRERRKHEEQQQVQTQQQQAACNHAVINAEQQKVIQTMTYAFDVTEPTARFTCPVSGILMSLFLYSTTTFVFSSEV